MPRPKPRLVTPEKSPGTTPLYERGLRLGAIRVRRDAADECRRLACDAHLAGEIGDAFRLHVEADLHDAAVETYAGEIGR